MKTEDKHFAAIIILNAIIFGSSGIADTYSNNQTVILIFGILLDIIIISDFMYAAWPFYTWVKMILKRREVEK